MSTQSSYMHTDSLAIGYRSGGNGATLVTEDINVELQEGELISLLGPNGSGKSTLIKTLAGMHKRLSGKIDLYEEDLDSYTSREIARLLSVVLTDRVTIGNLTVFDLVAFGRSPYTGWIGSMSSEDRETVEWAIKVTGLEDLVGRDITRLSDGERQKVMIARALAQDTSVILLDEPTAHLDLPNRVEIIRLLRKLAHETGKGIVMSTHELDLALKASDVVWLINNNRKLVSGNPEDLVLQGTFEEVFHNENVDFDRTTGSFDIHTSPDYPVRLNGDEVLCFWTARALKREGFNVNTGEETSLVITANQVGDTFIWHISGDATEATCQSIQQLIDTMRKMQMKK